MCTSATIRCETCARVVACLGTGRDGEPQGVSSRILVIRGPKGRMRVCIRAVRKERSVRWVISIVLVVVVWGDVVSLVSMLLLLGRLEGVSSCETRVVLVECESLVSSMSSFVPLWLR